MSSNKSFSAETSDRYARAVFELALENSELETVEKNIHDLLNLYNKNINLVNFFKNPTQSFTDQLNVINKIAEVMTFSKTLKNFLSILVVKRRIFFLKNILLSFLKLASIKKGKLTAELVSSKILSEEELKKISKELSQVIGSEINFDYSVDESLIGGFKMQIGSLMIDSSIKNKLKQYEQTMLEQ